MEKDHKEEKLERHVVVDVKERELRMIHKDRTASPSVTMNLNMIIRCLIIVIHYYREVVRV